MPQQQHHRPGTRLGADRCFGPGAGGRTARTNTLTSGHGHRKAASPGYVSDLNAPPRHKCIPPSLSGLGPQCPVPSPGAKPLWPVWLGFQSLSENQPHLLSRDADCIPVCHKLQPWFPAIINKQGCFPSRHRVSGRTAAERCGWGRAGPARGTAPVLRLCAASSDSE